MLIKESLSLHVVAVLALIATSCTAGLFDAVKNVAGGVVSVGNSCQAIMPSGTNCKNTPIDGSSYCQQHKCRMCNGLAWADGVCRSCAPKAEAKAKAERQSAMEAERMRRTKEEERSRLGRYGRSSNANGNVRGQSRQARRRRTARTEEQCDERPFAGLKLGMIAPFAKENGEKIKLQNTYLSIFEQVQLLYGKKSHLLNGIAFGSMPIHASNDVELQPYVDEVLSGMRALGYDMKRDMRHVQRPWRCKGTDCEIELWCNDIQTKSDGVVDVHKQLVLSVTNPKARQLEKQYAEKAEASDGIVHEVVPYGDGRFLHCRSGMVYSVKTNEGEIAYCNGIEESIVRKNGYVMKIPRKVVHGAGLDCQGEYCVSPYSIGAIAPPSKAGKNVIVADITEFTAGDIADATAFAGAIRQRLRFVLSDQAITPRWLAELVNERYKHTSRPLTDFIGADEASGSRQVMKVLASAEKEFQFPANGICQEHPLLYKELASGSSKDWCRVWLALNAKSYHEYSENLDAHLTFGTRPREGEIEAKVEEHEIILSFSGDHPVLVSVKCKFKDDGVSKDAVIAKYRKQFGDEAEVEVKDDGVKRNKSVSSLPRTRKAQRELDSMRMSDSGLARSVANFASESDPFGAATLDSPAHVYYQRCENISIANQRIKVFAQCNYFKCCAFLSNRSYNRLADSRQLELIEDFAKVPADAIIDGNGDSKVVNGFCGDELRGRINWIKETIGKLKAKDGRIIEITVTGLALQNALSAEIQKKADEGKARDEAQRKKKEADTLNF